MAHVSFSYLFVVLVIILCADFLLECVSLGTTLTLPTLVRPHIPIVFERTASEQKLVLGKQKSSIANKQHHSSIPV